MRDYAGIRSEYLKAELDIRSVLPNPVDQFEIWFEEVLNAGVQEPNAMTLASVSNHGKPSLRIVLLKGIEEKKFIFYTNYNSKKGRELENNSACAVNFFWPALERQVRIEGNAEPVRHMVSDEYYNSRPRNAQIGAWASPQSESIADRARLENLVKDVEDKFKDVERLPRPPHWGGYALDPLRIEFWQGRTSRLHNRIVYTKEPNGSWSIDRLAP